MCLAIITYILSKSNIDVEKGGGGCIFIMSSTIGFILDLVLIFKLIYRF